MDFILFILRGQGDPDRAKGKTNSDPAKDATGCKLSLHPVFKSPESRMCQARVKAQRRF